MCFDPTERYLQACSCHLDNFPSYFFYYASVYFGVFVLFNVILLSVYIVTLGQSCVFFLCIVALLKSLNFLLIICAFCV